MDFADEFDKSKVYKAATKKRIADIVAESAQFNIILTHILLLVFPAKHIWVSDRKHSCEDVTSFHRCMAALNRWYTRAAPKLRNSGNDTDPSTLTTELQGIDQNSVALYTNFLHMYYHTSRIVLCHHEVLRLENLEESSVANRKAKDPSTVHEIRHEIQDAVSALTECYRDLVGHGLARWLPISAIGCTALPLILSVLDIKLSSQIDNGLSIAPVAKKHQGNTLIEIMKTYCPRYDGADWVNEIVRHIVGLGQHVWPKVRASDDNSTVKSTDIFALKSRLYLRLALTLDPSFNKGKLPQDDDFPRSLRGLFVINTISPLPSLVPDSSRNHNNDLGSDDRTTHEAHIDQPLGLCFPRMEQVAGDDDESFLENVEDVYPLLAGVRAGFDVAHSEGLGMSAADGFFGLGDLPPSSPNWSDRLLMMDER